jgi:hypothetical protein
MSILDNGNGRSQPNMHDQIAVDTIEFLLAPLEVALALAAEARLIARAVGHTAAEDRRAVQPEGLARRPLSLLPSAQAQKFLFEYSRHSKPI